MCQIRQRLYFRIAFILMLFSCFGFEASATGAKAKLIVRLTNIEFRPNQIKAEVGDTIRFINKDQFKHDVYIVRTANANDVLVAPTTIEPGKYIEIAIQEKALLTVYCTIHGGMRGKISTTGSFELTEDEKRRAAARKVIPPIVKTGEALFWSKAQCNQCHKMGDRGEGTRGPNLSDIGLRSTLRAQKLGLASGTEYLVQSIQEPEAYVVEGYTNDMATVYQPPIDLNEEEIKAVIAYLQSQGGEVDTWSIDLDKDKLATEPSMNPFLGGDTTRGKTVFADAGCASCHTVGSHLSVSPGPDLTAIGAYRNWTWLAESIIDPNKEVGANWKYTTVFLEPDPDSFEFEDLVSGFLRENTDEQVKILVGHNRYETFPRKRVMRVEMSTLSKMPTNYTELLTFQQLTDLINYLQSLKNKK